MQGSHACPINQQSCLACMCCAMGAETTSAAGGVGLTFSSSPVADVRRPIRRGTSDDSDRPRLWLIFLPLSSPAGVSATGACATTRTCSGSLPAATDDVGNAVRGAVLSGADGTRRSVRAASKAVSSPSVTESGEDPDRSSLTKAGGKASLLLALSDAGPAHPARPQAVIAHLSGGQD